MSIFPATDLVVDVAQAADPQKLSAAVTRLAEMSSTRARPNENFADLVAGVRDRHMSSMRGAGPSTIGVARSEMRALDAASGTQDRQSKDAIEKFEAYIIQSSLETILPRSEQGIFGHGTAGGVWRSMVAEQIGAQIAKAGGFGIQKTLERQWAHRGAEAKAASAVAPSAT